VSPTPRKGARCPQIKAFLAQLKDLRKAGLAPPKDYNNPAARKPVRDAREAYVIENYKPIIKKAQPTVAEVAYGGKI
jgi:hypothetical protein